MRLVVGLGNPGPEYEATRHNVGFLVVERLAARHGIALAYSKRLIGRFGTGRIRGAETGLLEPLTYMNRSGASVRAAIDEYALDPASDLVVVYDDLDLPFGRLRLRPSGGAGGHNGLADVQETLGRQDFARLRFGIGRPPPGVEAVDHVLTSFADAEAASIRGHLDRAADAVEAVLADGIGLAMNRFNRDAAPAAG